MMNEAFVKEIRDGSRTPFVQMVEGKERLLLPAGWSDGTRLAQHSVKALGGHTLTGIVGMFGDDIVPAGSFIHVPSHDSVQVLGPREEEEKNFRQSVYMTASAPQCGFRFGEFMDIERFVIGLQSHFVQTDVTKKLVAMLSSISDKAVRQIDDDGVAQEVVTTRGVAVKQAERVPNPVILAPWRTFREIMQPQSSFVLRVRGGGDVPTVALFEAGGETWKIEAIELIANCLAKHLPKGTRIIA